MAKTTAEVVGKTLATYMATLTGMALVFVPGPQQLVTVPAGLAILGATYYVNTKGKKR